jgi:histidinol dehydrogenase
LPVVLKSATSKSNVRSSHSDVVDTVAEVITDVCAHGDEAVRRYSTKFDAWDRAPYRLGPDEIKSIVSGIQRVSLMICGLRSGRFRTSLRRSAAGYFHSISMLDTGNSY